MMKPFKLCESSPKRDDVQEVKQISKISDVLQKQQPLSKNIKINGLEKYLFKAFEQQKFSSFHEALGPALTGFLHPLLSTPRGKLIQQIRFQLVNFSEIYQLGGF